MTETAPGGSQSRRAYDHLRRRILDWELPPGARVSEISTAREIGGSRTPVREAIALLVRDGLVRTVPGRGTFVTEISLRDIVELFQMREALEVGVARLAARAPERRALEPLEREFVDCTGAITDTDNAAYYDLIRRFDQTLLDLCHNQRFEYALAEVSGQTQRLRHVAATDRDRLVETVIEHLGILRAVLAGDEADAAARVREHVRRSAENVLLTVTGHGGQRFVNLYAHTTSESGVIG